MPRKIIFSMCNQNRHGTGRTHCLAALDVTQGSVQWIRAGTTRRDFGVTGMAEDSQGFYAAIQARDSSVRVIHFDRQSFQIICAYPLRQVSDPHSLCIHNGNLLICSTGNNGIYRLVRKGGRIVSEELFWRYPEASEYENEVHLNCLASHKGDLFVTAFGYKGADGTRGKVGELRNVTSGQVCIEGMSQPHTILFHRDRVYCASSAASEVVIATPGKDSWKERRVLLHGYTRGLAGWGDKVLLGISANRTKSRSQGHQIKPDETHYERSEILMIGLDGEDEQIVIDATPFGNEIYEIVGVDVGDDQEFPRPWQGLRMESLRTAIGRLSRR